MDDDNKQFTVVANIKANLQSFKDDLKNLVGMIKNVGKDLNGATGMDKIVGSTEDTKKVVEENTKIITEGLTESATSNSKTIEDGFKDSIGKGMKNAVEEGVGDSESTTKTRLSRLKSLFSKDTFNDFKEGLKKVKDQTEESTNSLNKHGGIFKNLFSKDIPDAVGKTYNSLEKVGNYLKFLFTAYAGKKLFDFTLGQGMQFEDYTSAFKAIYQGDSKRADNKMAQLENFAKTTPYELPEVVQAGITLEGAGLDANRWLNTAGNLASKNKAKGSTIGYTSQILANAFTGNYGEAVQQLREQGISETMLMKNGVRFSGNGEVKSDLRTFMTAIEKAVQQTAGNQMGEQSQTVSGMLSNIMDDFHAFGRMISKQLYGDFKGAISDILTTMDRMFSNGGFQRMAVMASQALKPLVTGFKNLMEWMDKASQNGGLNKIFAGIATGFQVAGAIIKAFITLIKDLASALGSIAGKMSGVAGSANQLSRIIWGLVSAFLAFKGAVMIVGTLQAVAKLVFLITEGVRGLSLALKVLQSSNIIGLLTTIITALLMVVLQLKVVKDFLGGILDKLGLGQLKGILGLSDEGNIDDMYKNNLNDINKQVDDAGNQANQDQNNQDTTDWNKYADKGKDLETQYRTATDDIDIAVNRQDLTNQTNLQKLELNGVYKDSSLYSGTEKSGLEQMQKTYMDGVAKMDEIISKAGNDPESTATKLEAINKRLEYLQKSNEILLQIENNTAELKNAIDMIDLKNNKTELEKDINMQNVEIGGTRPETYRYWAMNREWLKQQMQDYQNAYAKIKSLIPNLNGEDKISAEIKALEYQKKANDLLLEIKKNTDPRNGTFNLPSDIRAYSLFEDRQAKGKAGFVFSGNSFVLQVKQLADQNDLLKLMDSVEETLYEKVSSDVRR